MTTGRAEERVDLDVMSTAGTKDQDVTMRP